MSTIFEKIIARQIPANIVYEDENVLAFESNDPIAPVHIIIIPKLSTVSRDINDLFYKYVHEEAKTYLGLLFEVAYSLALLKGIAKTGYRTVINNGPDSGQQVPYIHLHLIGGKQLGSIG
jgi:histidine triad (HIT) family protein